ncbi:MAG TPA: STT3 domain-containing protein [Candidatus Acidoferrales bacterium]|nr:STT3 domain-containing protein [Candidatus Acidoferrales bacterium]
MKETLSKGFKRFGALSFELSHGALLTYSALILIMVIAFVVRILPIRWEIPYGSLGLGEFDSFFEYSITQHMIQHGILSPYWPSTWVTTFQNFPWGLDMGTSLPVVPMVGAASYEIVTFLGVHIDLMSFLSLLAPVLGALAVFTLYFIGKDFGGKTVGLLAALFLALDPSVIGRSNLGWFETETIGVLGLLLFILFFLKAIEPNRSIGSSIKYSLVAGLALAAFCGGWGSAYYLLGLVALFAVFMVILKRTSHNLLISYSISFGLGLFFAINMPILSIHYLLTAPVLAVAGGFVLLCAVELWHASGTPRAKTILSGTILALFIAAFAGLYSSGRVTSIASKFWSTLNPFYRSSTPILESVAEHAITTWGQIYIEFGIATLFFIVGLYFALKNPTDKNVFLVLFGLTSLYFAASMVRLLVIMAPAFGLLAAIGINGMLKPFRNISSKASAAASQTKRKLTRVGRELSVVVVIIIFAVLVTNLAYTPQAGGQPRVYGEAYTPLTITASSLPISASVPQWKNMLNWMQNNLQETTVVNSWWDYGEWLTVLGNVTSLTDNTTVNTTQIENQGYSFMANETQSLKMDSSYGYDTQYYLVFETLQIQVSSSGSISGVSMAGYGDEGKWVWMARISGEAENRLIQEGFMNSNYKWTNETSFGNYTTNNSTGQQTFVWNKMGLNSTIFELLSYAEQQWANRYGVTDLDQTTSAPQYFTPAFISGLEVDPTTSEQYGLLIPLVCLYKVNWAAYDAATNSTVPVNG